MTETDALSPPSPIPVQSYRLAFTGDGLSLFLLILKNLFLTLVTFGFYFAWSKTNRRKFLWSGTSFHGQPFEYLGTGIELFKGYLMVIAGYATFVAVPLIARQASPTLAVITQVVLVFGLVVMIPFAVYWSRAYLLSRTRWRGIRMQLTGEAREFAKIFLGGYLLTLITFGLYGPVWTNNLHEYQVSHTQLGTESFSYNGSGSEVFWITLKGVCLMFLTFGLYFFWMRAELERYRLSHTYFSGARGHSDLTGGQLLGLFLLNLFGTTLTFGIAFPWIISHTLRTVLEKMSFEGHIDFARVGAAQVEASPAADGLADVLGVDFGL